MNSRSLLLYFHDCKRVYLCVLKSYHFVGMALKMHAITKSIRVFALIKIFYLNQHSWSCCCCFCIYTQHISSFSGWENDTCINCWKNIIVSEASSSSSESSSSMKERFQHILYSLCTRVCVENLINNLSQHIYTQNNSFFSAALALLSLDCCYCCCCCSLTHTHTLCFF